MKHGLVLAHYKVGKICCQRCYMQGLKDGKEENKKHWVDHYQKGFSDAMEEVKKEIEERLDVHEEQLKVMSNLEFETACKEFQELLNSNIFKSKEVKINYGKNSK